MTEAQITRKPHESAKALAHLDELQRRRELQAVRAVDLAQSLYDAAVVNGDVFAQAIWSPALAHFKRVLGEVRRVNGEVAS